LESHKNDIHGVLIKSSTPYFCDNLPKCKPLQIIFGRNNIAQKICNKLTHGDFEIYLLCVASLYHKMTPIFSQLHNARIPM